MLLITWNSLNSADFVWNSAEQRWFLTDSEWQFSANFFIFSKIYIFIHTSISRNIFQILGPICENKLTTKTLLNFSRAKDKTKSRKFGYFVTAQVTKMIWFKFSKAFSRLVAWVSKFITKILSSFGQFIEYWGTFTLYWIRGCHSFDQFKRFVTSNYAITTWDNHLNVRISKLIQIKSVPNQRFSALKTLCFRAKKISTEQRWFRADSHWNGADVFQFWTALNQRKTELISADVFHILWISAENCQKFETALFSADYLWDFNMGSSPIIGNKNFPRTNKLPYHVGWPYVSGTISCNQGHKNSIMFGLMI